LSLQGLLQAAAGNTAAAQETLDRLLSIKKEKYISCVNIASVYAAMGNESEAIEWLETGVKERDPNLTWISFDKEFEFLQPNARFQALLREVGLPEKKPGVQIYGPRSARGSQQIVIFAITALVVITFLALLFFRR
jgi:hypothetical protein